MSEWPRVPQLATRARVPAAPAHDDSAPARPSVDLSAATPARVALARTGVSLATGPALDLLAAHAQARDAVHATLDVAALTAALGQRSLPSIAVHSAAPDRTTYLRRPDLGRMLPGEFAAQLASVAETAPPAITGGARSAATLSFILADGLSAAATNRHAIPLLDALRPHLAEAFELTLIVLAEQARVALGDQIAAALNAEAVVIVLGERPGLSSPDSLGAYITWNPRPGRTDAERDCVSNIRPQGLSYADAAQRIGSCLDQARRSGGTGVALLPGSNDLSAMGSLPRR